MYSTRNLPNTRIDVANALRGIAVAGINCFQRNRSKYKGTGAGKDAQARMGS